MTLGCWIRVRRENSLERCLASLRAEVGTIFRMSALPSESRRQIPELVPRLTSFRLPASMSMKKLYIQSTFCLLLYFNPDHPAAFPPLACPIPIMLLPYIPSPQTLALMYYMIISPLEAQISRLSRRNYWLHPGSFDSLFSLVRDSDAPTLIASLPSVVRYLARMVSSRRLQQTQTHKFSRFKEFFSIISIKLQSFEPYLPFVSPFFSRFLDLQGIILDEQRRRLITVSNPIQGIESHQIDGILLKLLDNIYNKRNAQISIPEGFQWRRELWVLEESMRVNFGLHQNLGELSQQELGSLCDKVNETCSSHKDSYVNKECLACCGRFFEKPWPVFDMLISFYGVKIISIDSYSDFNSAKPLILSYMCQLLNESKGGIILIGCEKWGANVFARGMRLTEKDKDSMQQKLESYFPLLSPQISRNKEVKIDFVPVYRQEQFSLNSRHLDVMYVARIVLEPAAANVAYYIKRSDDVGYIEFNLDDAAAKDDPDFVYRRMLKKNEQNRPRVRWNKNLFTLKQTNLCLPLKPHYGLPCDEPDKGNYLASDDAEPNKAKAEEKVEYVPKTENNEAKVEGTGEEKVINENKKKKVSLLVADGQAKANYEACLNQDANLRNTFYITKLFSDSKLKLTKSTWVVYHYEKYEIMKKVIERNGLKLRSGKPVHLISAGVYLEVLYGFLDYEFQLLSQAMYQSGVDITVNYAQGMNNKKQYVLYMKLSSVEAAIFVYFYLESYGKAVKFVRGAQYFKQGQ